MWTELACSERGRGRQQTESGLPAGGGGDTGGAGFPEWNQSRALLAVTEGGGKSELSGALSPVWSADQQTQTEHTHNDPVRTAGDGSTMPTEHSSSPLDCDDES